MTKNKFEGKPMIDIPEFVPSIGFLEGKFGKEVTKEINSRYKGFKDVEGIGIYEDGVIKGSNSFYTVAVNEVIRSGGLRTATQADLERAIKTNSLPSEVFYTTSGFVLGTEGTPNGYLVDNLMDQVKEIGHIKMPILISLASLDLKKDSNSPNRLAFKLRDDAELIYAPILNEFNKYFLSSDVNEKTGLPKKLNGTSYLPSNPREWVGKTYSRSFNSVLGDGEEIHERGLSSLLLGPGFGIGSVSRIGYSNDGGRVIVVDDPEV